MDTTETTTPNPGHYVRLAGCPDLIGPYTAKGAVTVATKRRNLGQDVTVVEIPADVVSS